MELDATIMIRRTRQDTILYIERNAKKVAAYHSTLNILITGYN
jgi:hypothetical protein